MTPGVTNVTLNPSSIIMSITNYSYTHLELVLVSPPGSSQSSLLDVLDDVTAAFPSPSVSELSSLFRRSWEWH